MATYGDRNLNTKSTLEPMAPIASGTPNAQAQMAELSTLQQEVPNSTFDYGPAIPLHSLGESPAVVDCPYCLRRGVTKVSFKSGLATHAAAALFCCITIICVWVPYLFSAVKDVQHRCMHCGRLLATWKVSSGLKVHDSPEVHNPSKVQNPQVVHNPQVIHNPQLDHNPPKY